MLIWVYIIRKIENSNFQSIKIKLKFMSNYFPLYLFIQLNIEYFIIHYNDIFIYHLTN